MVFFNLAGCCHPLKRLRLGEKSSGEGGIRTHGGPKTTTVFETAPFVHSGTSPIVADIILVSAYYSSYEPLVQRVDRIVWAVTESDEVFLLCNVGRLGGYHGVFKPF